MKQYIKDGIIKSRNQIVLRVTKEINGKEMKLQVINPTEEAILADGWVEYIPPKVEPKKSRMQIVQELVVKQYNERTDISNEEALDYMVIVYPFENYIGIELPVGRIVNYNDKLWRVRQAHIAQEHYAPSMDTASLWEVIEKEHDGTLEDPIPYTPPMEVFENKYYIQENIIYKCIRNSGTPLSHNLESLIGIYVITV